MSKGQDRSPEVEGVDLANRLALRMAEAADALGISKRLLEEMVGTGRIPHLRINTVVLFPVASLMQWLKEQAEAQSAATPTNEVERTDSSAERPPGDRL
jgi:excisionase family DNA binding protein